MIYSACNTATGNVALVADTLSTGAQQWLRAGTFSNVMGDTDATTSRDVYVTNSSYLIQDLNPATGAFNGTISAKHETLVVVGNPRVFATCSVGLCAYNRTTCELVWSSTGSVSWSATGTSGPTPAGCWTCTASDTATVPPVAH